MKFTSKILMGIIVMMLSPFFVQAQLLDPVTYEVTQAPETVKAGEAFEITVKATIEGEWHLYSIANDPDAGPYPTQFSSKNPKLQIAGDVSESEAVIEYDPNFDTDLGWHTSNATFTIPLAFQTDASGSSMIDVEVLYQVCDDKSCLPPKRKSITQGITISGVADQPYEGLTQNGSSGTGASDDGGTPDETGGAQVDESSAGAATGSGFGGTGIFSFLWLALTAGFAALLTPCVFPMIPLTVSFFSKQKEGDKGKAIGQAIGFGIAI